MRLENIEVTFKMKLPIDEPDGNGTIYTREAIIKAYEEAKNRKELPIEFPNDKGEFILVGITQEIELIEEDGELYATGSGSIYHGGTEETVDVEVENKIVNNFTITGIGVARK